MASRVLSLGASELSLCVRPCHQAGQVRGKGGRDRAQGPRAAPAPDHVPGL